MDDKFYNWYKIQETDKTFEHLGVREISFISFEAGRNSIPMQLPVKPEIADIIQELRIKKDAEMVKQFEEFKNLSVVSYYNGYGRALGDMIISLKQFSA